VPVVVVIVVQEGRSEYHLAALNDAGLMSRNVGEREDTPNVDLSGHRLALRVEGNNVELADFEGLFRAPHMVAELSEVYFPQSS